MTEQTERRGRDGFIYFVAGALVVAVAVVAYFAFAGQDRQRAEVSISLPQIEAPESANEGVSIEIDRE